jgi:hypothetical protein
MSIILLAGFGCGLCVGYGMALVAIVAGWWS